MSRLEGHDLRSTCHTDFRFTHTGDQLFVTIVAQCYMGCTDKVSSVKVCEKLLVYSLSLWCITVLI